MVSSCFLWWARIVEDLKTDVMQDIFLTMPNNGNEIEIYPRSGAMSPSKKVAGIMTMI